MSVKEINTRYQLTMSKTLLKKAKEKAELEEVPLSIWIVQAIQNKLRSGKNEN